MKFSVNLYRSRASYHWLKVLVLKKLWQLKFRLLSSWNIADVFLSAKWLRKEIGKKLSLSILVSIKNFHDRIFAFLIGIGIAITIFFWYRDRDLDQDFLSSSVSLSRSRKTVIDDKPAFDKLKKSHEYVLRHPSFPLGISHKATFREINMDATRTNAFTNRGRYASVTYSITFFKKKYIAYLYFLINF